MRYSVDSQPQLSARWLSGDPRNWLQRGAVSVIGGAGGAWYGVESVSFRGGHLRSGWSF